MVLNYTFMYQGFKTSYKTEILSRDKKSILLMPLFLGPASLPAPTARLAQDSLLLHLLLCVDFLQVSCSGDSFYLKGQVFQRGTKQN